MLEAQGFDVKSLWRDLADRIARQEVGTPGEDDARYELPNECPRTESHLKGGNEVLDAARLWQGLSYELSPGMRGLLRDKYGLTPTQTVTCVWVEPWPGTRYPRRMLLRSDVHVDPRARRHVLTEVVVDGVGTFFRLAKERDEAEVAKKMQSQLVDEALTVGRIVKLESEDRWAVEDLSGVKVGGKVEVVAVSEERFTVVCMRSGNKATVARDEFHKTAEEYFRLHASDAKHGGRGAGRAVDVSPALDELIAKLGLG